MNDDAIHYWIRGCLKAQHDGEALPPEDHDRLIRLVDQGILGMDGFKYCWPWEAEELWAKFHPARKSA